MTLAEIFKMHYYIAYENKQVGPFTKEELKEKRLTKNTLVWHEGLNDWTEAKNVSEIADLVSATPPPLPNKELSNSSIPKPTPITYPYDHNTPIEKYDRRYSKETDATALGLVLIIIPFIFIITGGIEFENQESLNIFKVVSSLISIIIRIIATVWVTAIAKRQNRNTIRWGIFAFLFPSIALIIIGQTKKLYDPLEKRNKEVEVRKNSYEEFLRERGL